MFAKFIVVVSRGAVAQLVERPPKVLGYGATLLTRHGSELQPRHRS